MANIRAVAKLAGVSVATVSRAYTDPEKVAEITRKKVYDAAKDLNYKPNSFARLFRTKKTNTVLVIVPDLANPFFAPVLAGLESAATEAGLSLLLSDSRDDPKIERNCLELVETKRADGVIQLGARSLNQIVQAYTISDMPFVHAIEVPEENIYPSVAIDNRDASRRMMEYILKQGHRRIAIVGGRKDSRITQMRLAGALDACRAFSIEAADVAVEFEPYSVAGGKRATQRLLEASPDLTALFCMSDELALGAIKAVRDAGRRVPEDVSVTGFDNIVIGEYIEPGLTTVTQPARQIGEIAMQLMAAQLADPHTAPQHHVLSADLVIRDSVTPPRSSLKAAKIAE
ncbi:LacI family DNA-binding transcriptional regulator [Parvularcula sp. LCG005]|uniref:LacI family DNA-binding transcriptional regulator n=1 Tax=Parvularcula sp. LCG005 TaxID=3078805 RepID=UPI0029435FDF|nr:LacI family DNA-binding transcriptional regulator [Parvularcula sp. LCG005]WOI53457.1 LacI family DNA-binding transcriptional regulator [Parvularcula sp. LCG005]